MRMELRFPPLAGGVIQGLNDAGIETFEGDYAHFVVRESAQNSLDAAASANVPVRLELAVHSLKPEELSFFPNLKRTLEECQHYWRDQPRAAEFFRTALQVANEARIYALRVSDYGTTGVSGGDAEMNKPWFGLVRSRGVSIKSDEASAGAFGIGKDAPLAASAFRTVIYSTRTLNGDVALQGICRLATHETSEGSTQGTGFIGDFDVATGEHRALRNPHEIARPFLRERPGLDVWILGFRFDPEWEPPFVDAALYNFWPAIHTGRLVLKIGNVDINTQTIATLMMERRHEQAVAEAIPYYQSLVSAGSHRLEKTLPTAGRSRLWLQLGSGDLPRRICMTRKTGMVIYSYAPRTIRVPFAGLFLCDDQNGNRLLKALEPPRHDAWEVKRAATKEEKDALNEIKSWIKISLKALVPDIDSEMINEDAIADLLPDEDLSDVDGGKIGEPDLGGQPILPDSVTRLPDMHPTVRIDGSGRARGEKGEGGGEGGDVTDPQGGDGQDTGGRIGQQGSEGEQGGGGARSRIRVSLRSFRDRQVPSTYHLIARSAEPYSGDVLLDALTEDGGSVSCAIAEAYLESGEALSVTGNRIEGINIAENDVLRLRIILSSPARYALRLSVP